MASNTIHILKEIGDMRSISPYEFTETDPENGIFNAAVGNSTLQIQFEELYGAFKREHLPKLHPYDSAYFIIFTINGEDGQVIKSDVKTFLRVLKTVAIAVDSFIQRCKPAVLLFTGSNKDGGHGNNDNIKSRMYKQMVSQNMSNLPGYNFCEKSIDDDLFSCLYLNKYSEKDIQMGWEEAFEGFDDDDDSEHIEDYEEDFDDDYDEDEQKYELSLVERIIRESK